nr:transcription-repair coupling factor [Clostridia bacterium]
ERLRILCGLGRDEKTVVIATPAAAAGFTVPPGELSARTLFCKVGGTADTRTLALSLEKNGYVRSELVDEKGLFSVRGDIVDFFSPESDLPVRIELFGSEIDSVSYFDPDSQRRTGAIGEFSIIPSGEVTVGDPDALAKKLRALASSLRTKNAPKAKEILIRDAQLLEQGVRLADPDKYLPLIFERPATLFDHIGDRLLLVCDSGSVKNAFDEREKLDRETAKALFEEGVLCRGLDKYSAAFSELCAEYEKRGAVFLDNFRRGSFDTPVKHLAVYDMAPTPAWNGSAPAVLEDLESSLFNQRLNIILTGTRAAANALQKLLDEKEISNTIYSGIPNISGSDLRDYLSGRTSGGSGVMLIPGSLSSGLKLSALGVTLTACVKAERAQPAKPSRRRRNDENAFTSLEELQPGNYVVHNYHGIGVYDGIVAMESDGQKKDYIKVNYAGGDVLYVSVTELDALSKYIGNADENGEYRVRVNRLDSVSWQRTKQKVRGQLADIAEDLIRMYSDRLRSEGHAFEPDTDLQRDFELRFEYDETPSQLQAADEIKADMERPCPMDRLLCGDVGFGKTEVALRAAFKCVCEGMQVAILVPTTILAMQHYRTMLARFRDFPVNVAMLSRFCDKDEKAKVLRGLESGTTDIVVGTHSLIAGSVRFSRLGLLIVDEEQRFGVMQKEKFRSLYPSIDILTLTATPIPRTLNFALSGIRDMSSIDEAPMDRSPVQTFVIENDFGILDSAVKSELARNGQVFWLHNRISDIEKTAAMIAEANPGARVDIGHGKMGESELSEVWRRMTDNETDVLVCTTIIETGVDVPNANTLIIEDADRFGLAQLHQLRGRVGRSSRRANAYFAFNPDKEMTETARRRLEAIREYTEFGSGYKIAVRDLEIRGAGNLLGAEQHGAIAAVGYNMFIRLLREAVDVRQRGADRERLPSDLDGTDASGSEQEPSFASGLRGHAHAPSLPAASSDAQQGDNPCPVDLRLNARIPESYIKDTSQRLEMYRKVSSASDEEEFSDITDEFFDRFGEVPASVLTLLEVGRIRSRARSLGITGVKQTDRGICFYVGRQTKEQVVLLSRRLSGRAVFAAGAQNLYRYAVPPATRPDKAC